MMKQLSPKSGFSLLELSVVLGVIALVVGMSLSVGDKQVEKEEVRSSWNELRVIKEALFLYGKRHGSMPCPAPLNVAKTDSGYGLPAPDCDATPTAGVTHIATPLMKTGGVPFRALGLSDAFAADDWGNRYVYAVSDARIVSMDGDDEGVITVNDLGGNVITPGAVFAVYSHGTTGLGGLHHEKLTTVACSGTQLDRENCGGTAGTYIDAPIRKTEADATYYDDLLVWGKRTNILAQNPTTVVTPPIAPSCEVAAGITIAGMNSGDKSGTSVSAVGDVNGDGYDDVIIGATDADPNGAASGQTYVVFGKASGWTSDLAASDLDGSNGFVLNGVGSADYSGRSVSTAGDVNGDGYGDILIGADFADPNGSASGEAYLVFGKESWAASINLSTLDGTTGVIINGTAASENTGTSVSSAGDVNNDGYDDLVIGADQYPSGGNTGKAYIVFGKASGWAATLELSTLNGTTGVTMTGVDAADVLGVSVSGAGDVNGDSYDDIIIGAAWGDSGGSDSGEAYLIFGKASWGATLNLGTLNGTDGVLLEAVSGGDNAGEAVSGAGDVNGDGYDDVIIGAFTANPNGANSGQAYLLFGKAAGWTGTFDLSTLNGTNGITMNGAAATYYVGQSVSGAGDVNGDGYDDVIIGANGSGTPDSSGYAYVVFGKSSGWAASLELSSLDGSSGVAFKGIDSLAKVGAAVSGAGDVNNDGYDDLIIGAEQAAAPVANTGESYLVLGNNDWSSTSGTVELSALTDPALCTSNACVITIEADLDGAASETSWRLLDKLNDDVLISKAYTAAENNSTRIKTYALPRAVGVYALTLDDSGGDGFATVNEGLGIEDAVPAMIGIKKGPDDFASCNKLFGIDATCGFDNYGDTDFTCTSGSCSPMAGVIMNGDNNGPNNTLSGWSVSDAGDVNGDGYGDVIIGAPLGHEEGNSYVIFGKATGWTSSLEILSRDGTNGFIIVGEDNYDHSGTSVSGAGDVNGDGYDDILVGAPDADPNGSESGEAYVIFGKAAGWTTTFNISTLNGTNGMKMRGRNAGDHFGESVSGAGDVNNDGYDDILVGAPDADSGKGWTYLIFGRAGSWAALDVNGMPANGSEGGVLEGIDASDLSGTSVSGAGDVNNDGYDDILIGAYSADPNGSASGEAYLIFGNNTGWADQMSISAFLDGSAGFVMNGIAASALAGYSVADAGDVNGDGYDDIMIGSYGASSYVGKSYLVFGKSSGWIASLDLADLDGTTGVAFNGIDASDNSGYSVSGAADVNNDGYDDIIIGSRWADPSGANSGETSVVFGKSSGWAATFNLSSLNGTNGFTINGVDSSDNSGYFVSNAGDVNGDGYEDVLTSAPYADPNGNESGETYLILGSGSAFSTSHNVASMNDPAACEGCSPACNSGCSGTTLVLRACNSGSCDTLSSTPTAPQCAAPVAGVECDVTCNGTNYPDPGDTCTDGSIYAGISPDGNKCMYTTPANAGTAQWAAAVGTTGVTDEVTGESNTITLDNLAPSYPAATNCAALTSHSNTDWYLPSLKELAVLYDNRVAIGGFGSETGCSTEVNSDMAAHIDFSSGDEGSFLKTASPAYRCVRKDGNDDPEVVCDLTCNGTNQPDPGDVCTDGSIFVGISRDCNKCMYTKAVEVGTYQWSSTAYTTSITDAISGYYNTVDLDAEATSMPAGVQCYGISAHGKTDWYLPSYDELYMMYLNSVAIGGWSAGYYWTSTEYDANQAYAFAFSVPDAEFGSKTTTQYVRCVRMDGGSCSRSSLCAQSCNGSLTPNPGDICTDGSMYLGLSPDNGNCMYAPNQAMAARQFLSSGIITETSTSLVAGASNTAALLADGHTHPVASYCDGLSAHSQTDWWSPSRDELVVAANAYTDLAPLVESTTAWSSSTSATLGQAWAVALATGTASEPTSNSSYTGLCVRTDTDADAGGTPVSCEVICGGSATPNPGDVCTDGSFYIGVSPDGNKCMYMPMAAPPSNQWATATPDATTVTDDVTGADNTTALGGYAIGHPAAAACSAVTSHSKSDWYLPATNELQVIYDNRGAIPVITPAGSMWSSTQAGASSTSAKTIVFGTGTWGISNKTSNLSHWCVRKDGGGAVTCNLTCNGTNTPSPGDVCTDGSKYAGVSPDGNVCMYASLTASTSGVRWADSTLNPAGTTSLVTGAANTATLGGMLIGHPAAAYCTGSSAHGQTDWYLPANNELVEVLTNRVALGFPVTARNWSSSESTLLNTMVRTVDHNGGDGGNYIKTATSTAYCVRKDSGGGGGGGPASCPNIGDTCADGSLYAGKSPDGNVDMFLEAGKPYYVRKAANTSHSHLVNNSSTGEANTATLVAEGLAHPAANFCDGKTAHSNSDWYLPAVDELQVLYDNRVALGGFPPGPTTAGGRIYSSTNTSALGSVQGINLSTGATGSAGWTGDKDILCVRKD